ncbi:MAG TPA: hypothetical protein VJM12_02980 [Pyrinomonadaceae bacterium]|nr:hypothetical protein [Pyrinomonadaceae bacterium]
MTERLCGFGLALDNKAVTTYSFQILLEGLYEWTALNWCFGVKHISIGLHRLNF